MGCSDQSRQDSGLEPHSHRTSRGDWGRKLTHVAHLVPLQCRSARRTLGSRCLMRQRGHGGCCAPRAPMPGWQDLAVRRWASSGTGVPLGGWQQEGGRSRPDPRPAQGTDPLGAGCADSGCQWHVRLLLCGRGKASPGPEAARGHLRVVRRAAGRWEHTPRALQLPSCPTCSSSASFCLSELAFLFLSPSLSQ